MQVFTGSSSIGSTGSHEFVIDFQPKLLLFTVSRHGTSDETTVAHVSTGSADGTRNKSDCILADSTGNFTSRSDTYCVRHFERVGGVPTEVVAAYLESFDEFGYTLYFDVADINYKITVTAIGD